MLLAERVYCEHRAPRTRISEDANREWVAAREAESTEAGR